jgi:glutamate-1-semialdehyde 2,1-aminomutase
VELGTEPAAITATYEQRTPASARLMERAARSMPRGLTRTLSWFGPYPVVFNHGRGAHVFDVDGNRYLDLFSNGMSLMHGHAYEPVEAVLLEALGRGTAWPGASAPQIEFAELLCRRIPGGERVRFANTGTEATMLAVKLARHLSGRQQIVKAWDAYHGSYDDLEVGLAGRGEEPGRVALATFGEIESYERILAEHGDDVAAVIVEPVQYTGMVTVPPTGFLPRLRELTQEAGVLLILDDCLMFRLAEGGSATRFGFEADITCLGKWIGGGLPVGAVVASAGRMECFDLDPTAPLYHGGSFNGNILGALAGQVAVADLTAAEIDRIDALGAKLRAEIEAAAGEHGVAVATHGIGGAFGLYVLDRPGGEVDHAASASLHLAAVNRGLYYGAGGEFGISTAVGEEEIAEAVAALRGALGDLAAAAGSVPRPA